MTVTSPLGKYAQIVAAIVAVGVIAGAVGGHLFALPDTAFLDNLALIAAGAVFGSAATVNGVKPDIAAANRRLDALGAPPAAATDKDGAPYG